MKVVGYISISASGGLKISKRKPSAESNEVVVQLNFTVPDELFTNPVHKANINIVAPTTPSPTIDIDSTALVDWIGAK